MNRSTIEALNRLNRRFYDRHGRAFGETRAQPWPGWDRALSPLRSSLEIAPGESVAGSIVDVGCGNGRFASHLGEFVEDGPWRYLGIDSSPVMVELARERVATIACLAPRFRVQELTDAPILTASDGLQDLAVMFGILHHIPGSRERRRLLVDTAASLARGGILVASFWQFGDRDRFRNRIIPWQRHNRHAEEPIDEAQLEPGDHLLAWGPGTAEERLGEGFPGPRRYCHFASPAEADSLVNDLGLEILDRFFADGRSGDLNLYFVLRHP